MIKSKKKLPIVKGLEEGTRLLRNWNSQKNPPKVYVLGKRIHHGPLAALIGLYGLWKGDEYLTGLGLSGVIDDIYDINHWLDFEDGGNPNSLIDII